MEICKKICESSHLTIEAIEVLAGTLDVQYSIKSSEYELGEILFDVLYKWHCKNPNADRQKLAELMHKSGCCKEAFVVDPTCELNRECT